MPEAVTNPLLLDDPFPRFSLFRPEHVRPAIESLIASNLAAIDRLVALPDPDWERVIAPLHDLNNRLENAWAPVVHINNVAQDEHWREAHDACLPLLSDYHTRLGQHRGLFHAYQAIHDSARFAALPQPQKKAIQNALRDFRLSGIALDEAGQARYAAISARLSALASRFSNQLLDATRDWQLYLPDDSRLAGLPDTALQLARSQAAARDQAGFLFTLDAPSYLAVMTYADERALRREMYEAYVTRASECGPSAGRFDNGPLIDEILALRHELAVLLGFPDYAAYSLATKMADKPEDVSQFLQELLGRSRPVALQEFAQLQAFASTTYGMESVESWDVAWLSEKLREQNFAIDQEALRQYFPVNKVLAGLFGLVAQLFSIRIVEDLSADCWHPDARLYRVLRGEDCIAGFYLDLYAREGKRGGAWMGDCRVRYRRADGELQLPVAFLTCNFMPPTAGQPSLLTFDEVTTLFHEFGHGLHHMLTRIDCATVSGINGVEWDAVELPSQLLENWCWQARVIPMISAHATTGEPLPTALLDRLLAARNFQSGMQMVRQLEFAWFDLRLHWEYRPGLSPQGVLDAVRSSVSVLLPPAYNRFQNSFSHIFAGGYAAGYYSYKWAEVLSADVFSAFEETDILDDATSTRLLEEILEKGGSEDAMTLFRRFRGREPRLDALLRHSGLAGQQVAA